ncbi:inositol monophosphatase [Candidatus Micrarchaeota archaeon]|nr:inositol monophosphatase [Candidatus Micrarchaeota archaeon]
MMDFALETAEKAGVIALKHFRKTNKVSFKSRQDILTEADTEVEKFIMKEIGKNFPEHGVLAEESGRHRGKSDYLWVLDPIDGTVNFAAGIPCFAISIGLAYKKQPILGVVYDPYHNEFIYAEKGKGAYLNGRRVRVCSEIRLINCVVATDLGHKRSRQIVRRVKALLPVTRAVRILGSASIGLADVALDRVQAYVHNDIQPWDVAAACIIIKEAGGGVINFKGKPWQLYDRTIIASNKALSKKLLKYVG